MATQVQFRRGTTTQNNAFTGAAGEITYDTQVKTLRLHDGTTAGGGATLVTLAASQTLTNKTMSTSSVWAGNAIGLAYGGTGTSITAAAGAIAFSTSSGITVNSPGTSGQLLQSAGTGTPIWVNASSLTAGSTTNATNAVNISGGSAGYLVYQTDTDTTGFIAPGTSGYVLRSTGASTAPGWVTSALTIGSTAVQVGDTQTSFAGFTSLDGTSGSTSYFATPTAPVLFAGATTATIGYGSTASSTTNLSTGATGSGNTKTVNIGTGGAASSTTNVNIGSSVAGTTTINSGTVVGAVTTQNLFNTVATTVNAFGAATTIGIGAATGTLTINNAATVFNSTSNIKLPVGNTAARPGTPAAGMVRYNSEISSFEGYASGAWSSLGGVKSVDGLTYILAETSAGASNDELEFYTATDVSNTAKRGGWNKTRLYSATPVLIGSQADLAEYPNALLISANGDTTNSEAYIVGVIGEGVADGVDTTKWGVGVYGAGTSKGATVSAGVLGKGIVSATGDTGASVGIRGYSTDTHAGGINIGLYSNASGSAVDNYALYMVAGNMYSGAAQTWSLYDNNASALSLDTNGKTGILKVITTNSSEGVTMSGTLGVTGVATLSGNASVGGTLAVTGNQTNTADLAVNGGDITTTATTATIFNTNATTLSIGGAATTLNIGAAAGTITAANNVTIVGNLTVQGTTTTEASTALTVSDSAVYLNDGATDNSKDIGLVGTYVATGTKYTGLVKDATDSIWKFFSAPTNAPSAGTTVDFTGATYDAVKMGALTATNGTFTSALTYGGVTLSNSVTGTGSMVLAAAPTITGNVTLQGVTSTGATGTGNIVFSAAPTITGNVTLQGVTSTGATGTGAIVFGTSPSLTTPTLGVASATSINKVAITAPATSATLTLANGSTLATAGAFSQTFTATATTSVTLPTTGTLATLAGSETFTNKTLTSPTMTTPTLGVASATSINKVAITAPATSATLTIADSKTLTVSNTLTFTGTDSSSVAFGAGGTVLYAVPNASTQISSLGVGTAASGTTGEIRATNAITSYYSDDRLKTKTGNIQNALEKVLSLDGFHYHANETAVALGYDASKEEVGLSAQQVQAVLPEVIAPAPIDPQYMTMHYERLVPLLVEAIKEQQKQIEELKAKLGN